MQGWKLDGHGGYSMTTVVAGNCDRNYDQYDQSEQWKQMHTVLYNEHSEIYPK